MNEPLFLAQVRAHRYQGLAYPGRGQAGGCGIHRLVQRRPAALLIRLPQPADYENSHSENDRRVASRLINPVRQSGTTSLPLRRHERRLNLMAGTAIKIAPRLIAFMLPSIPESVRIARFHVRA